MKILVLGSSGVGSFIKNIINENLTNHTFIFSNSKECDLTDYYKTLFYFSEILPILLYI